MTDGQGQTRPILLKQQAAGLEQMTIVLADSRHNRAALELGAPTLKPALPCSSRAALAALRHGEAPDGNAIVLV